jgi:uncharacterized protein
VIESLLAAALGAAVGLVMGLTGAGGTILAVPLLVWGLGWSLPQAAPVALLAVAVGAGVGSVRGLRENLVRWRAGLLVGGVGLLSAPLGLWLAPRLPHTVLAALFAGVLLVVAWRSAASAWRGWRRPLQAPDAEVLPPLCPVHPDTGRFQWRPRTAAIMTGIGLAAGLVSGLLGVGGGFLVLPALLRISHLPFAVCVATTLLIQTIVASGTVLMGLAAGRGLPWLAAAPFVAGVVVGLLSGQRLALQLRLSWVQAAFALLVAAIGVQLGLDAWAEWRTATPSGG